MIVKENAVKQSLRVIILLHAAVMSAWTPASIGATSEAQVYADISGPELQNLLQDLGYRAELTEDAVGDPKIRTSMNGFTVNIFTYNCTYGSCKNIQFRIGLDLTNGTSLERVNEYNRTEIYGQAWMDDENDPWLDMLHNVADGVTDENLAYTIERFERAIQTFADHFKFRK